MTPPVTQPRFEQAGQSERPATDLRAAGSNWQANPLLRRNKPTQPRAIGFVNNYISYSLLLADLEAKSIPTEETVLVAVRELEPDRQFLHFHPYPGKPEDTLTSNLRFIPYYIRASRLLRAALRSPALEQILVVNQDNIVSNHLLNSEVAAEKNVLCEGMLNFNVVESSQHGAWRDKVRPALASVLRLGYQTPRGHISGSEHPEVSSVVTFRAEGLVAPQDKIVTRDFLSTRRSATTADPNAVLVIETSLCRLMPDDAYRRFAQTYADWIGSQNFSQVFLKRHPRSDDPYFESLLPGASVFGGDTPIEQLAAELPAQTIIGPGTTPLVTLKLLRPDLRCIDVGRESYAPFLYTSDSGMAELFAVAGVESASLQEIRL